MPREIPGYREKMEMLNMRFPDQDVFTVKEIQFYMGWKDKRTAYKYLGDYLIFGRIFKTDFAKLLCQAKKPSGRCG